jgi:MFS family permease
VPARAIAESADLAEPIRKNRAFRVLLAGSSVSMLGSRVTTIGYPMLVLYLTGSAVDAGWVGFAATAPSVLVYMPAGALVDRWDPRRIMLLSEVGRGLAIASVVIAVAFGRPSIGMLIVAAVVEEILEVFSTLAERRYVRALVPRGQASAAQVRMEARTHLVVLMGRPLGGLLFEIRPIAPFLVDVVTFVFSVGTLLRIKSERPLLPPGFSSRIRDLGVKGRLRRSALQAQDWQLGNDVREGMRWLLGNRFARTAVTMSASTSLICQAMIMAFLAMAHSRQLSSIAVCWVLGSSGLGGAAGSFAASRMPAPSFSWVRIQMCFWIPAFFILSLTGGESLFCMALAMAILGFTGAMGNIEVNTYLTHNVAENMLGRVTSIGRLMSFSACAIGWAAGGFLFQRDGIQDAVNWLLAATVLLGIYSLSTPSMRAGVRRAEAASTVEAPGRGLQLPTADLYKT